MLWVILAALALGSFANVFLARFPKGESLWRPGSRCPHCGAKIRWRHNLPVIGWVILRGRCADCKEKISPRYPAMEAAFGGLAWGHVAAFGMGPESLYYLGLVLVLLLIAWVDWETQYIFDVTSLPLLAAGLPAGWLFPELLESWWSPLAGAGAMYLGLVCAGQIGSWWAKREALGGGDIKLMAAVGAFLGAQHAWKALVLGVFLGLPLMLLHQRLRGAHWREPAPLGPGLCLGAALTAWNLLSGGAMDPCFEGLGMDLLKIHS